jgi:hypothetical protein
VREARGEGKMQDLEGARGREERKQGEQKEKEGRKAR